MGSLPPELSLLKPTKNPSFKPKLISDFLSEVALIGSSPERSSRVDEFLNRLNEEKSKIEMFKRELPLSRLILDEVIETVNKELIKYKKRDCEDEKMKWMSSFQLWTNDDSKKTELGSSNWSQNSSSQKFKGATERTHVADEQFSFGKNMATTGAFSPFQGFNTFPTMTKGKENIDNGLSLPRISFRTPGSVNPRDGVGFRGKSVSSIAPGGLSDLSAVLPPPPPQQHLSVSRKQRRCWSPNLHKLFVQCLQRLGGPRVATPKQIRELMKVEGLTNDEVKSHLQKYRIHTRKLPDGRTNSGNGSSSDYHVGESSNSSSAEGPLLSNNMNVVENSLDVDEEVEVKYKNGN